MALKPVPLRGSPWLFIGWRMENNLDLRSRLLTMITSTSVTTRESLSKLCSPLTVPSVDRLKANSRLYSLNRSLV